MRAHKLRSFLTLVGVILAVTTLVTVISFVEGMNKYVAERIANLGSNVFGVDRFGVITSLEEFIRARRRPPLTHDDYRFLKEHLTYSKEIAAVQFWRAEVRYAGELLADVRLQGVTPNFTEVTNIVLGSGRLLNETDDRHRAPVCFVGPDISTRFFPHTDPVGKQIRVGSQMYQIVGVGAPLGSVFGQSQDNYVHIPMGTFEKSWQPREYSLRMFVQAWNTELIPEAQDEVRVLMRAKRHVRYSDRDNFAIVTSATFMTLWEQITGNIARMAVGLTMVFLVVGGVVIMNIMLASVTERTREIGIRKSLGARRRHIIMQFLMESATLSLTGGMLGVLLAYALGALITAATPLPIHLPLGAVLLGLSLSTAVGLFFGIYPAMRAARLDPIVALRFEN